MTSIEHEPSGARPTRTLMARLVGSFLSVSLLTIAFVALAAFLEARHELQRAIADRLAAVALEKEADLNRWVDNERRIVEWLAGAPGLEADAARFSRQEMSHEERLVLQLRLERASSMQGNLEELFVLAPKGGEVLASTVTEHVGKYHVADLFYTRGKSETYVQNVFTSPITGRPTLTIATPIRDSGGEVLGVLAGNLDLSYVDDLIESSAGLGVTVESYLVSPFNDFVSSERFGREEYRRGVFSSGIDAALEGASGIGVYENYAGVPVIGAYRWNPERELALVVEMGQAEAFAPARRLVVTILGIGLGSALVLTGVVFLLARQIARPVHALTQAATAVARGDFDTVAPVMSSDEVGLLATTFNDMTERLRRLYSDLNENVETTQRALGALEESRALLQAIIDNSTALIAVTDSEDRFVLVNSRFGKLIGLPEQQAIGKTPGELLPNDAAALYLTATAKVWKDRKVTERELTLSESGEARSFLLVAFPLGASPGEPYAIGVVGTDLTELQRAQRTHEHLEAQVQHAQKLESLGLMAGGIAHDFNNILTSVLGNTELALTSAPPGSRQSVYLERVVSATKQASHLTSQMLAYAGKSSFHRETLDLNEVILELTELATAALSKNVGLTTELSPAPAPVQANRAQLAQLVMNLITNAAEAIGEDSGVVRVRTDVGDDARVRLEVHDSGAGMDERTRERIFDPFFSTKGPGRGLGLAAVQGIVQSAGGELRVDSRGAGMGSTFVASFPLASGSLDGVAAEIEPPAGSHAGTVLVVDDEPSVRAIARELLSASGFRVREAENGAQAIETYASALGGVDVVLLDMTMPGLSGAETLREIRAIDPNARVILSSGYDSENTLNQVEGLEGVTFLQKPYRARTLLAKVSGMLTGRVAASDASTVRG